MALSAEVAEIVEHLTNHGCSNVVGAYVHGWTVVEQCICPWMDGSRTTHRYMDVTY